MDHVKTADQSLVRELNISIVMDCIRLHAPLSRATLANLTGLNRSTVSLIVNELISRGFVHETSRQDSKIGRPGILLQFAPDAGFALGVEVGVDFIAVILTNFVGEILWRDRQVVGAYEDPVTALDHVAKRMEEAIDYGKGLGLRPMGIGVGFPGLVDVSQGKLVFAPNLRWADIPVRQMWTQRFHLPVFVDNEANCACMGERFYGIAHDIVDFIYLKTGVGLGGGIMIGGVLFRGSAGYAGEVGHTTLYNGGELCGCGRRGCWETYVRPSTLIRDVKRKLQEGEASIIGDLVAGELDNITMDVIVEAACQQDPVALQSLETLGGHMAVGITNLVNIFNPELVVLGGELSRTAPWLVPVIEAALRSNVLPPLRQSIRVAASAQGEDACLLGAIALVLDNILREPLNVI